MNIECSPAADTDEVDMRFGGAEVHVVRENPDFDMI
jgi:hypothetical protein